MEFKPISDTGGAEIRGLKLEAGVSSEQAELIDEALGRFGALVIREQPLSPERLVSLARLLGPVQPHVQRAYQHPDVPEVVFMTNQKSDGSFDEAGARRGAMEDINRGWHSDLSYDPVPAKATLLHTLDVPSSGGNTCFCNVTAAYQRLPDAVKQELNGLRAEFPYAGHRRNRSTAVAASALDKTAQGQTFAVHPVINQHSRSHQPGIYANPLMTSRILDIPAARSEQLLEILFEVMADRTLQWEHRWRQGDTLIWDNRGGVMHSGRLDYPKDELRRFIRTTVSGAKLTPYVFNG